jgi:hypothetical protein
MNRSCNPIAVPRVLVIAVPIVLVIATAACTAATVVERSNAADAGFCGVVDVLTESYVAITLVQMECPVTSSITLALTAAATQPDAIACMTLQCIKDWVVAPSTALPDIGTVAALTDADADAATSIHHCLVLACSAMLLNNAGVARTNPAAAANAGSVEPSIDAAPATDIVLLDVAVRHSASNPSDRSKGTASSALLAVNVAPTICLQCLGAFYSVNW